MIYRNARIIINQKEIHGYLELDDNNVIIKISEGHTNTGFDCQNKIIMPGFIDTHTHGGYGMSFDDFFINDDFEQKYRHYLEHVAKEGIVGFVATNVSLSLEHLNQIANNVHSFLENDQFKIIGPSIVGWFFEGPFINIVKKGAHDEKVLIPIDDQFMQTTKKLINIPIICAVAPEIDNNLEMIHKYANDYIFALGHSNASYAQTLHAFDAGVKRIIHLYNAMSGFGHRETGIVNAVFNQKYLPDINIELIADGVHVVDEVIETTHKLINHNNLSLVSDCLAAKGLSDGTYELGTLTVDKKEDFFFLRNTNTLAGSGLGYNKIASHYKHTTNCSLTDLVKITSTNAAKNLKLKNNFGNLTLNMPANLIMVDDNLNVFLNISEGKIVYERK